jgi:S-methylmethionine-dependent homocysteine/selenocysteine methylase
MAEPYDDNYALHSNFLYKMLTSRLKSRKMNTIDILAERALTS